MFKLPVHALILFCASRWVIPSVLIPSMVRTTSPIPTCARAALPPSLSWNITRMVNEKLGWFMYIFSEHRATISYSQCCFIERKKKNYLFSFVSMCLWKLLHYLSDETVFIGSCSYFTWMTGKVLHSIAYFSKSNSTLLAGSCAHSPRDTSRGRHTEFPGCQVPASSLIIYETFLTRGERKPAFSIPGFTSKQSLQGLCVWQWLVTCMEDFINSEADFSPAASNRKSKVQRHRQTSCRTLFCLSLSRFRAPSDPQYIQTRIRKASWAVCLFDQGHCWSSAQLPLVHLNETVLQQKPL